MFKEVMSNEELLIPLLTDILGRKVVRVKNITTEVEMRTIKNDKAAVYLDVLCEFEDGELVDVELQVGYRKDTLKRARFYSSVVDAYRGDTAHGKNYNNLKDIYVIFLCSSKSMPADCAWVEGRTNYNCYSDSGKRIKSEGGLSDGRTYIFINYEKYHTFTKSLFDLGAVLCNSGEGGTYANMLRECLNSARISVKEEVYNRMLTVEEIQAYKNEGREEGREEIQDSIARNLLMEKMPPEKVARLTGLSLEKVLQLY